MRAAGVGALAAIVLLFSAGTSHAAFGIVPGSLTIAALNAAGQPEHLAGAHPDRLRFGFELNTIGAGQADGNMKDLVADLPAGLIGDPTAIAACSREAFDAGAIGERECPTEAQVGTATVAISGFQEVTTPVYNVAPAPGQMAVLGFNPLVKFPMIMRLRPTDYGLTIEQSDLVQSLPVTKVQVELWGVPADHQQDSASPQRAFLTLPTRCDGQPLSLGLAVRSWQEPSIWHSGGADSGAPLTDCAGLRFEPRLEFGLSNPVADAPTGADVTIALPRNDDPAGRADSELRSVSLSLPTGMSISPGGAAGLGVCSDDSFGLGRQAESECPAAARLGSIEVLSPALDAPQAGSLFLGPALPGNRFRLLAIARSAGVEFRLTGSLRLDPDTGRITTELSDLPQVPLDGIALHFDSGPRALLTTPLRCGTATAEATFTPYAGGPQTHAAVATSIDRNPIAPDCTSPLPFAPALEAGSSTRRAGHPTAFSVTLRRRDGEESPDRFRLDFPPGLSAAPAAVERCKAVDATAGTCPPASRIGSAVAEIGSGQTTAPLAGDVYLTDPYRGAPLGLAIALRASLGPFDLGRPVVRAALRVGPRSGRVTIETDSLPRLVGGVAVRFRTVGLDIDRPGFLRNPTSCKPGTVRATVASTAGGEAQPTSPFSLDGCDNLGFRPRLSMTLSNPRGRGSALRIAIRPRPNDTNLRGADFRLPQKVSFDPSGLGALCSRHAAEKGRCPEASAIGNGTAHTPLLDEPLRGQVYVVQPHGDGMPDLWTIIRGDGIRLDIRSKTLRRNGHLHTRLIDLPDVPLSSFVMRLDAGGQGILSPGPKPCPGPSGGESSTVVLEGQDRASRIVRVPLIRKSCKAGASRKRP